MEAVHPGAEAALAWRAAVPMAAHTSLQVGGPAAHWLEVDSPAACQAGLAAARAAGWPTFVLGGGSNVVVADAGFAGLVLCPRPRGLNLGPRRAGRCRVSVAAGEPWDEVVARTVDENLAGFECLSGIPGLTGAVAVQNVGAYGQEVADTLVGVSALECASGAPVVLAAADLDLGYRSSRLLGSARGHYVLWALHFDLAVDGPPTLAYPELRSRLPPVPSLAAVRAAVLELRRDKSMILDSADPNHRSCGSFFVNPWVGAAHAAELHRRLGPGLPQHPAPDGRVKLSAAWLVERAGFRRGHVAGRVGLSSRHALALINRGGATAGDVVHLAHTISAAVHAMADVWLVPEPVAVGFGAPWADLLRRPSGQDGVAG